jgi:hypothetical protein
MKMSKFKIFFLLLLSMYNIQSNIPLHNNFENHCIRNEAQKNIFKVVSIIHSSFSLINKKFNLLFIFILYVMKQHNKHKIYMINVMKVLKSEICT